VTTTARGLSTRRPSRPRSSDDSRRLAATVGTLPDRRRQLVALVAWLLADATTSLADGRVGAAALAATVAAGTLFLLFTGLVTLPYGDHAVPLARALAAVLA
jgi:hypothetical protein